jgi:hypothetical protein
MHTTEDSDLNLLHHFLLVRISKHRNLRDLQYIGEDCKGTSHKVNGVNQNSTAPEYHNTQVIYHAQR